MSEWACCGCRGMGVCLLHVSCVCGSRRVVNPTEVDIVFARVKEKGVRRIKYRQFLDALCLLAAAKYPDTAPSVAFASFLDRHVFLSPAAVSVAAVVRPDTTAASSFHVCWIVVDPLCVQWVSCGAIPGRKHVRGKLAFTSAAAGQKCASLLRKCDPKRPSLHGCPFVLVCRGRHVTFHPRSPRAGRFPACTRNQTFRFRMLRAC
jgi:hypothetical protein